MKIGTSLFQIATYLCAALLQPLHAAEVASPTTECDRGCLKTFSDLYFDALAKHNASLLPVTRSLKFTETGRQLKLGEGFWKTAGVATYRLEIFDPETGGVGVHAIVMEQGKPVSFLLRLKIQNRKITEIETVVARKEDAGLAWAPETLHEPPALYEHSIRPAEQNSRLELMAAADAYFRALETNGTLDYHPAPLLPDTNRIENGFQTTNMPDGGRTGLRKMSAAEQFERGLFKNARVYDRRYAVVDVEHGVVLAMVRFGVKPSSANAVAPTAAARNASAPFICEFFAINGGKIRQVQAVIRGGSPDMASGW